MPWRPFANVRKPSRCARSVQANSSALVSVNFYDHPCVSRRDAEIEDRARAALDAAIHGHGSSFGELPVGIICTFLTASALLIDCVALAIASDLPTVLPDLEM
jgi:hypothetical protein